MRVEHGRPRIGTRTPRHIKSDAEREQELKGQIEGLLVVPVYLVILAWIARALGWW